jgi:hypothetical protein
MHLSSPPPGSPLRQADRAYKAAIADLADQAYLTSYGLYKSA